MKKSLLIFLSLIMIISLCACAKKSPDAPKSTDAPANTAEEIDAKEIFKSLVEKTDPVWFEITCGGSAYNSEKKADFNENYFESANTAFDDMASLHTYIESVFTEECAKRNFYDNWEKSDHPPFIEKDGILYTLAGGKGWPYSYDYETVNVLSQTEDEIKLEADRLEFNMGNGEKAVFTMKLSDDGVWRFDTSYTEAVSVG